jgi:hypothetical protein
MLYLEDNLPWNDRCWGSVVFPYKRFRYTEGYVSIWLHTEQGMWGCLVYQRRLSNNKDIPLAEKCVIFMVKNFSCFLSSLFVAYLPLLTCFWMVGPGRWTEEIGFLVANSFLSCWIPPEEWTVRPLVIHVHSLCNNIDFHRGMQR